MIFYYYSVPVVHRITMMSKTMWSVRPQAYLLNYSLHVLFTKFLCALPKTVTRSSDGVAIGRLYILPAIRLRGCRCAAKKLMDDWRHAARNGHELAKRERRTLKMTRRGQH